MALTNEQFDQIIREYEARRDQNRLLTEQKRAQLEASLPQLLPLENRIASLSVQVTIAALEGNPEECAQLEEEIKWVRTNIDRLLTDNGFQPEDLQPVYTCPDCQDTGYILSEDGARVKCHCFLDREMQILYNQSNIRDLIATDNFSALSYNYCQGEDLDRLKKAVDTCRTFVENFDKDYNNLLFYGTVGTGKSFLSCCIAYELLKSHHSVLYMSSQQLFDTLADLSFRANDRSEKSTFIRDLYGCDLLILDDLGTELSNSFVASSLFTCINERNIRKKATVISTNLAFSDLRDRYSDRVFSRLTGSYTFLNLTGPDVRIAKKINQ